MRVLQRRQLPATPRDASDRRQRRLPEVQGRVQTPGQLHRRCLQVFVSNIFLTVENKLSIRSSARVSYKFTLFFFLQMFYTNKFPPVLNTLLFVLFSEMI